MNFLGYRQQREVFIREENISSISKMIEEMKFYTKSKGNFYVLTFNGEVIVIFCMEDNYDIYLITQKSDFFLGNFEKKQMKVIGQILRQKSDKRVNESFFGRYL